MSSVARGFQPSVEVAGTKEHATTNRDRRNLALPRPKEQGVSMNRYQRDGFVRSQQTLKCKVFCRCLNGGRVLHCVNVTDESIFLEVVFIVVRLQRFGWNFNISNQYFLRLGDGVWTMCPSSRWIGEIPEDA